MLIAKMRIFLARLRANLYNEITMNRYSRLLVFIFLFTALVKTEGLAENFSGEADVFDDIKIEMISHAQENKKLADENKALKAKLVSLQLEIERYEQEIKALDPQYIEARAVEKKNRKAADQGDLQGDDLIREAQNIYLSGQSMALDGVQRLRELQLYDLQYQKQELELDLESMKFLDQKVSEQRRPEMDALKRETEIREEKTREALIKIDEEKKAAFVYSQRIELLKMENKALKQRIGHLKQLLAD